MRTKSYFCIDIETKQLKHIIRRLFSTNVFQPFQFGQFPEL
jgi:hypothetical protein